MHFQGHNDHSFFVRSFIYQNSWRIEASDLSSLLSVSSASWIASGRVQLHQSVMQSDRRLAGLTPSRLPAAIRSIIVFTSRSCFIL